MTVYSDISQRGLISAFDKLNKSLDFMNYSDFMFIDYSGSLDTLHFCSSYLLMKIYVCELNARKYFWMLKFR